MESLASTSRLAFLTVATDSVTRKNWRFAFMPMANTNASAVLVTAATTPLMLAAVSFFSDFILFGFNNNWCYDYFTETYTYQLKLVLERVNDTMLHYDDTLRNEISPQYRSLASRARTGLKQALMKTDLSNSVQDSQVMGMHPTSESELQNDGVLVDFFVHLKEKQDERDLKHKLMKSLEGTNFVLGDSEIIASRFTESLTAEGKTKLMFMVQESY